jgi:nicotinamidase-related amidase
MKPALLVVDMQNEFFVEKPQALESLQSAVEYINATIALFRRANAPVIVVSDINEPDRVRGRESFAVHSSITVLESDQQIDKRFGNAFWQTDLDERLRAQSVDMVIVSGFCAEYCILDTYRGAVERGYGAALLRNGIAGPRADHIRVVETICELVSYGALAGFMA